MADDINRFDPLEICINFLLKDKLTLFQTVSRWKIIEIVIRMKQFHDSSIL